MRSTRDEHIQAVDLNKEQVEETLEGRKPWKAPMLREFAVSDTASGVGNGGTDFIYS